MAPHPPPGGWFAPNPTSGRGLDRPTRIGEPLIRGQEVARVEARVDGRAEALLAEAFARRYRYPPGFPGFTARARFGPPRGQATATVALCGPGEVEVVTDERSRDEQWLLQVLRDLSRQVYGHDYGAGEGRFDKSLVEDPHPLGPLVVLHDDPHQATFRVRNGRVTLATRRTGTLLQVVRTERWHVRPDGRWLPARFTAEFWDDAVPAPLRVERYWDLYRPIDDELLPALRRIQTTNDAGTEARLVLLRAWRMEGPAT